MIWGFHDGILFLLLARGCLLSSGHKLGHSVVAQVVVLQSYHDRISVFPVPFTCVVERYGGG